VGGDEPFAVETGSLSIFSDLPLFFILVYISL
jgi:hypothetical protein